MNRAKTNSTALLALLSGLLSLALPQSVLAQARLTGTTNGLPNGVPLAGPITGQHYFAGGKNDVIPPWMLRRKIPASLQRYIQGGRAPGDSAVIRQTQLLTKSDPSQQFSSTPAPSQDEHPFYSADEKYIYFDSDRVSDTNTAENATKTFNLFRMFPDGSGIAQLLPDTINQIEPNIQLDGNRVAYVAGGSLNFGPGLDAPTSSSFQLYVYDISNGGAPLALTKNNASGIVFTDVRHPSWSPGGSEIAFAGQTVAGGVYHLYKVNSQTGVITQLTQGISNDTAPAWSPDGHVIAFTTNGQAFSNPTALNPVPTSAASLATNTDIWVITPNQTALDPHRVTNSSSITGGLVSNNKNASWSTLNPSPIGVIPGEPGGGGISENMLAFASTRADSAGNGIADSVKATYDIWFMHAGIKIDPARPGIYTVTSPESVGNAALHLRTSTPDTAIDPNDPTSRFDPNFVSNEDYPSWPAYINSYRIIFQSDRGLTAAAPGNELNLWAATILDINAPALLKYDIQNNEIIHVARDSAPDVAIREVGAGERVRFRIRAADYESGIESCFIQIKCPNSSAKSPDGKEHKIFWRDNGRYGFLDANAGVLDVPMEADAQAIQPYNPIPTGHFRPATNQASNVPGIRNGEPTAYTAQVPPLPNGWPSFNQYLAGLDDAIAFSGFQNPPDYVQDNIGLITKGQDYQNDGSYWMRLWDDGPISKGGHEPEGETAGDGLYTNAWTTPSGFPSDWTLDVIIRDTARSPFAPNSTTLGTNWKIYDNIWGFTSAPFQGSNGILYVNDYDSGQRFYQTHFGPGTDFNSGGAYLSKSYNGWPTESWMTEYDPALIPTRGFIGTTAATVINYVSPLGVRAYQDGATQDTGTPVTGRYDIWRVLCRGPVPDTVLNSYKGHVEIQPADVIAGGTGPRSVFVAERCIIWHSPYAGDLFVGPGTIVDADTQVRLTNFVKTGGRLFLNGQDTAWALSLGQVGASSAFLSSIFKVTYAADSIGNYPPTTGSETYAGRNARGSGPIGWETWFDAVHAYPGANPDLPPNGTNFYRGSELNLPKTWGALNNLSVDRVAFTAADTPDVASVDDTWASDGSPAITWVTDISGAPIVSKVIYAAGGWESINPEWFPPPGSTGIIELRNVRSELMHNVGDYLRTGRIFGTIRSINGALPLKGVFIRAVSNHTGKTVSTALTLSDGSFILSGLDATGGYGIDAALPGFLTQHAAGNLFHGGYQSRVDIFMTPAQPGSIAGTVTVLSTGAPVAGVVVEAMNKTTGEVFTAITQAKGDYIIKNVPSDTAAGYLVKTPLSTDTPPGTLDTLGYGASVPTSYGGPEATAKPAVTVSPSQAVTGVDFALTLFPGSISGVVRRHDKSQTDPSSLVAGATITATATVGTKVYTATSGADGTYKIDGVDPGTYKVTASAPGYSIAGPITVTVNSKLNTVVNFIDDANGNFALVPVPPGSLSGLVQTSQGIPVPGATVAVVDANGVVLGQTTTGATQTKTITLPNGSMANYTFNYIITNVPAGGNVIVGARKDGYNPDPTPTQTVLITTGVETTNVNFTIDPLQTFPSGKYADGTPILSLASAPFEYSGVANNSVATLFGVPNADVSSGAFFFATWLTDVASYVNFPTPPADTFHLGRGYFIADSNGATSLALTIKGTPADPTKPFNLTLKPGWNLIGNPFPFPINFLNLKVIGADGVQTDVVGAQTGNNPSLGAALWSYNSGIYQVAYTLDPYRGYWIRAFDNRGSSAGGGGTITLVVDPAARQDRSAHVDTRGVLTVGNRQSDGWTLNMVATAGSHKSAPTTVGQTRAALDTYDRYKLEAPPAVSKKDVTMAFEHPEWANKAGNYSVDVRSANTLTQSWTFTVTSTIPNEPVTLTWPNLAQVSKQKALTLTDLDTKQVMDLRARNGGYTIAGTSTGLTRHFQLSSGPATRNALQLTSVVARINGGSRAAAGAGGSVNISYNTTAPATVQVVISKNGRTIRTVDSGNNTREAGPGQVVWDMKDNQGQAAPGDTYNVEVRAQDTQGHTVRQIVPLVITR